MQEPIVTGGARMCVGCMWEAETEGCTDGAETEE